MRPLSNQLFTFLYIFLSLFLFIFLSIYQSILRTIYLSIHLFTYLSEPSIHTWYSHTLSKKCYWWSNLQQSIFSFNSSFCIYFYVSIHRYLSIYTFFCPSIYLSSYLSPCLAGRPILVIVNVCCRAKTLPLHCTNQ